MIASVSGVNDLVEVLSGLLLLLLVVYVCARFSEVIGGTVCCVDHEGRVEKLSLCEIGCQCPHVE